MAGQSSGGTDPSKFCTPKPEPVAPNTIHYTPIGSGPGDWKTTSPGLHRCDVAGAISRALVSHPPQVIWSPAEPASAWKQPKRTGGKTCREGRHDAVPAAISTARGAGPPERTRSSGSRMDPWKGAHEKAEPMDMPWIPLRWALRDSNPTPSLRVSAHQKRKYAARLPGPYNSAPQPIPVEQTQGVAALQNRRREPRQAPHGRAPKFLEGISDSPAQVGPRIRRSNCACSSATVPALWRMPSNSVSATALSSVSVPCSPALPGAPAPGRTIR